MTHEKSMDDFTKFAGFIIKTSVDREKRAVYGIAYCPICSRREESHDHGRGEKHALIISVSKIRAHMQSAHGCSEEIKEAI